jgi:hypothetical protein
LDSSRFGILDALDQHYRLHWWVRDRNTRGEATPGVEPGVVVERRTAFSWLVHQGGHSWDEIQLPTMMAVRLPTSFIWRPSQVISLSAPAL